MFTNWLRSNRFASVILAILRIYLGWGFLSAGWEKLTGAKAFSAAGFIKGAITSPVLAADKHSALYPTYTGFLKYFALPNVGFFNHLIPFGEFLVGIGLILGTLTTAAAFFAMVMNFAYLFAGTVSTNPWNILISIFIIVAGFNAGKLGGDFWVIPFIRRHSASWFRKEDSSRNIRSKKPRMV
jgi:thiosulfate dehydrogenase (quinone) large subunit